MRFYCASKSCKLLLNKEMAETNEQIEADEKELLAMLKELTTTDTKKAKDLQDFLHLFE